MQRWAEELGAHGDVLMLADGNADFAVKSGLAIDLRRYGLGIRSNRYAMLVADRVWQLSVSKKHLSITKYRRQHRSMSMSTRLIDKQRRKKTTKPAPLRGSILQHRDLLPTIGVRQAAIASVALSIQPLIRSRSGGLPFRSTRSPSLVVANFSMSAARSEGSAFTKSSVVR